MEDVRSDLSQAIQSRVDVAQVRGAARGTAGGKGLVQQGENSGERRTRRRGAADVDYASAAIHDVSVVLRRRGQRNIGGIARVVVGGAGAGLPDRFRKQHAGAAARGREIGAGGGIVRGPFGNVGKRGASIGSVDRSPITISVAVVELRSSHGRNLRNGG